jgi:homoserine kinase
MNRARHTVTVKVPASTSNCGAGFDSLGLALGLHNHVRLTWATGLTAQAARPEDERAGAMVAQAANLFFRATSCVPMGFVYQIDGDVPAARGLGSSVTVIAGVLAGLDAMNSTRLPRRKLVELATAIEGHPENASAGILGGFTVSRCHPETGAYIDSVRVPISAELAFVVASPGIETLTKESRAALPATIPYADAVRSINSATYLAAAMAAGEFDKLQHAVADFMHEPYRLPAIPGGRAAILAGIEAGALTGWLSGSGSSVLCVVRRAQADAVAASMCAAFWHESVPCEARVLSADNDGLRVD